jgi:hypothetical protein
MAGLAHDVSRELRDPHGRWTKGGAALRRIAKEAADAQTPEGTLAKVRTVEPGKGKQINGHWVDRPAEEGHKYRVKLKKPGERGRDTKVYVTPEEAAHALHTGSHNGAAPPAPRPPSARPGGDAPFTGKWNTANEDIKGTPEHTFNRLTDNGVNSIPAKKMIVQAYQHGTSEVVEGLFAQHDKETGKYSVHVFVPMGKPEPVPPTRKELESEFRGTVGPGAIHHPKSLDVKVTASAADKKLMRQKIIKASSRQGKITPDLVANTAVTVTKTPHGSRKQGTLASHTGVGNTLHVKPEVLIGNNAQAVLDYNRGSWWVPTDKEHDLADNVLTHEYGHGLHAHLYQKGILQASRTNASITGKPEQDFWRGFAAAINREEPFSVHPPKTETDAYGRQSMNVVHWVSQNKSGISRNVSKYGSSNMNEMLAELWTEYQLSSTPRAPAKYFGDYVTKRLGAS